ncbi:MAG: DsbA family protein [Gammaproteobacteria bacterium]
MSRHWLLTRSILLIFMAFILAGCGKNKNTGLYNALPINTDGNPTGKIVLVEFLDYANPACLKMAPIISEVMEQRPNVRVIYHPIVMDTRIAYPTRMVLAAGLQDRFLAAHHLMINSKADLSEKQTIDLLAQAFIDTTELNQQVNGPEVSAILAGNEKLATVWQVTAVPTFFIGRFDHQPNELVGTQTLSQLLAAIDKEASK